MKKLRQDKRALKKKSAKLDLSRSNRVNNFSDRFDKAKAEWKVKLLKKQHERKTARNVTSVSKKSLRELRQYASDYRRTKRNLEKMIQKCEEQQAAMARLQECVLSSERKVHDLQEKKSELLSSVRYLEDMINDSEGNVLCLYDEEKKLFHPSM